MTINKKISLINFYDSNRSKDEIKFIILHYVGAVSTAKNNAEYFYDKYRGASAHYFIDDNEIWQVVEDNDASWAIGANKYYTGARNSNSISVEMCCYIMKNGNINVTAGVEEKAVELVKMLMKKYNIDVDHVIRHYDATRKNCPAPFVKDEERWNNFKKKLQGQSTEATTSEETTIGNTDDTYTKRVKDWQQIMNMDYKCNLAIDGSYGPDCKEKALKYYLYYKLPTIVNEHVKFIQEQLNRHGANLELDRSFGPATEQAVKQFQKDHGLEVDGYVGADTTALLLK